MKVLNEAQLSFWSKSTNEAYARSAVSAFFAQLDPTVEELTDIKTAVSEAVTNAIVHAYRDNFGVVYVTLRVLDSNTAYIKIRDRGCGIEDVPQAMEPMFTTAPEEERAGLGFAVMQSFMDSIKVSSIKNRGTTVTLTKRLKSRSRHA